MPVYEQPGRSEYQDKSGKKTSTITYVGDAIATAPALSGYSLFSQAVVTAEAGTIRTVYQYESVTAGTGGSGSYVGIEIIGSLRTIPLQAHPRYATLTAEEQKEVKDFVESPIDGSKAFPAAWSSFAGVTTMTELATKMLEGQQSYYDPSVIVRKTYTSSAFPSGYKLGKIRSPGVTYDAAPTNANWLLISVSARGPSPYTITEEYELSGEGGWDADLYT